MDVASPSGRLRPARRSGILTGTSFVFLSLLVALGALWWELRLPGPTALGSHLPRPAEAGRSSSSPAGSAALAPLPQTTALPPLQVRWFYYVPRVSRASLFAHLSQMDYVSPAWFSFRGDGSVVGADDPAVSGRVRAAKARLVPIVGNGADGALMHAVLASPPARLHAVQAAVSVVLANRYDGIHLDLEGLPSSDREALVTFVRAVAVPLRSQGKLVTMALPAKTHDVTTGWAGPYDYQALGELCDLVTVMAYDYRVPSSAEPGPVAPLAWVEAVAHFATSQIPPSRVLLGVPFYGYDWNRSKGPPGRALSYPSALAAAALPGATLTLDQVAQSFSLRYQDGNGDHHEAWFEDGNSLEAKLTLARRHGLAGLAAWRLGQEDPGVWEAIAAATAAN